MKTYMAKSGEVVQHWWVVDASDKMVGRLASDIATVLMGKHKPTYEPYLPMGDFVVVVNAKETAITGNKALQKVYYRHSGYPGGLKERTFAEQLAKDPRRVIEHAVKGMIPHNSHGRELFRHLKVYAGPDHPHEAQVRAGTGAKSRAGSAAAGATTTTTEQSE